MSNAINNAARQHDRAVANVWACLAVGVPAVLVCAWLLLLAMDAQSPLGVLASVGAIVLAVSIVANAAAQSVEAGRRYRLARDAGCARLDVMWTRAAQGRAGKPGHGRPVKQR